MRKIVRQYRREKSTDKEVAYLFVGKGADPEVKGYMPRAGNYGFIFSDGLSIDQLFKTIAHELGHGVFHLQHIFEETSLAQGSTSNLMDMGAGTDLHKYQWDFIHDPAPVVWVFEDDEEGEAVALKGGKCIDENLRIELSSSNTYFNALGKAVILEATIDGQTYKGSPLTFYSKNEEDQYGNLFRFNLNGENYTWYETNLRPLGYAPEGLGNNSIDFVESKVIKLNESQPGIAQRVEIDDDCNYKIHYNNEIRSGNLTSPCDCSIQSSICDRLNLITGLNQELVNTLADQLKERYSLRKSKNQTFRSKGEFYHVLNIGASNLNKLHYEQLEEKLYLLHHYTDVYMGVIFIDLDNNSMYDQATAAKLAKNVVEAAGLDQEEIVLITVPISNYESILAEKFTDCIGMGFWQFGSKKHLPYDNILPNTNVYEAILDAFSAIEKPYFINYHFVVADGSLVNIQVNSKANVSGYPFIHRLKIFQSPNKRLADTELSELKVKERNYL